MEISSPSFYERGFIPERHTCDGENISPALDISGIPAKAVSMALIMDDPDAPIDIWTHWLRWNIPIKHHLKEGYQPPMQGTNDFGRVVYDGPCPSASTHYIYSGDKQKAILAVAKAIEKTTDLIKSVRTTYLAKLLCSLHELHEQFSSSYDVTAEGVGFYVSPAFSNLLQFPFPVAHRVQIADKFLLKEILELEQYALNYVVLYIDETKARCFKGSLNRLEPGCDLSLLKQFPGGYGLDQPHMGTSYTGQIAVKSAELHKYAMEDSSLKNYYYTVDQQLGHHLGQSPLILVGAKNNLSLFEEITHHKKNIIATNGTDKNADPVELDSLSWKTIRNWVDDKDHFYIGTLIKQKWQQHAVDGITDVWKAAKDGKGLRLLVERNYVCPGFMEEKTNKLHLKAPHSKYRIIMDAVEDVMRMVLKNNGDVTFLQKKALAEHQHIALITRY